MKSRRYLNVILTVNAALLAGVLWTQVVCHPVLETTANALDDTRAEPPNAAEQRLKMIERLEQLKRATDATYMLLKNGEVKVRVTNAAEMRPAQDEKD